MLAPIILVSGLETCGEAFVVSTLFQLCADVRHEFRWCHARGDKELRYIQAQIVGAGADLGRYLVVGQKTITADAQVERFGEFLAHRRGAEFADVLDLDDSLNVSTGRIAIRSEGYGDIWFCAQIGYMAPRLRLKPQMEFSASFSDGHGGKLRE